ncbi:MAG: Type restriction-modification system, restriction subunit [Alphaproteobacteria bacterium]|nr:Type restriction-modification system, restriction subunit [Alphaproteobacteria bacterium]
MIQDVANFGFLRRQEPRLLRLAALAERYFHDDPPGALIKLRQFAELIAKDVAARQGALPWPDAALDDVLRTLRLRNLVPRDVGELFYHLKRVGNSAVHEDAGTASDVLAALKIARQAAIWYHRSYGGEPDFRPGPFVPPETPLDPTPELRAQIEVLEQALRASGDVEAKARLAAQEADARRLDAEASAERRERDRKFWEEYAAETEAGLHRMQEVLARLQAQAAAAPPAQLALLAAAGAAAADRIDIDEAATRAIIDGQLRAAGWKADTLMLRHSAGARPSYGEAMAIAEWPTKSGPADYALFVDGRCVGIVEAKRKLTDVPGRLGQAKRYARDIALTPDELPAGGPWTAGDDRFRVPFTFVTNGRPYVKQLETKSGIWFWDARRPRAGPRGLSEWFSPRDLLERLEQEDEDTALVAGRELGVTGLRPYQQEAIRAVAEALGEGRQTVLLAMATGTGKTRLAIALMYELLRSKRFRRILFLVDRNALGRQTLDAMSNTDTSGFLKFDQVFPIADLARKFPEATDRVQVATVQAMIRRVFDDPAADRPTPGTYGLIIVDEAHRGYTLDAELREEDLGFRNLEDYLSAYRRVLDYFDAAKVALTATPALHTREIFGDAVFHYGYRQAVIDGWLIDHRPPRRITTALSQTGISFEAGEQVNILDPRTGHIDLFDLDDQVDFEVAEFNKKVYTRAFNRAVAEAVAAECPRGSQVRPCSSRPGTTMPTSSSRSCARRWRRNTAPNPTTWSRRSPVQSTSLSIGSRRSRMTRGLNMW